MPDVIGAVPQVEPLQAPNTTYVRPQNPLLSLAHKIVPGTTSGPDLYSINMSQEPEPEPEVEQQEEAVYEQPQPVAQPEIKGNPFARLRVVERERNLERRENEQLREQLSVLAKAVEKSGILAEEDTFEEEIPTDPLSKLAYNQEQILKRLDQDKKEAEEQERLAEAYSAEAEANNKIKAFAAKADALKPGLYQEASSHLLNVWIAEVLEDNEGMPLPKAQEIVMERINSIKAKAIAKGLDPGEEFMKRSILHGFNVQAAIGSGGHQVAATERPARQIAQERERANSLSSISSVQGAPASDVTRNLSSMSERDRVSAIMLMAKERGQMSRPPSLSDTLRHKIRR